MFQARERGKNLASVRLLLRRKKSGVQIVLAAFAPTSMSTL
jgi:hypothetical protein